MFISLVRYIVTFFGGGAYRFLIMLLIGLFTIVVGLIYSFVNEESNLSMGEVCAAIVMILVYATGVFSYGYLIWLGTWKEFWDRAIQALDEFQK